MATETVESMAWAIVQKELGNLHAWSQGGQGLNPDQLKALEVLCRIARQLGDPPVVKPVVDASLSIAELVNAIRPAGS